MRFKGEKQEEKRRIRGTEKEREGEVEGIGMKGEA